MSAAWKTISVVCNASCFFLIVGFCYMRTFVDINCDLWMIQKNVKSVRISPPRGAWRLPGFVREAESRAGGLKLELVLVSQPQLSE